jgi:probable HAF family extracellular repeat protein
VRLRGTLAARGTITAVRTATAAVLLAAGLGLVGTNAAQADSPAIDMKVLPLPAGESPGYGNDVAYAVNGVGKVAGSNGTSTLTWQNGTVTDLGRPEAGRTYLNDFGQAAGTARLPDSSGVIGPGSAVTWMHGAVVPLLPGYPGISRALGINDLGQILVEYGQDPSSSGDRLGIWQAGRFTPLDVPGMEGVPGGMAGAAINGFGEVAGAFSPRDGSGAFVFRCGFGRCTRLTGLPGEGWAYWVSAIDPSGDVAGTATPYQPGNYGYPTRAVRWSADGSVTDLGTLGGPENGIQSSSVADGPQAMNAFGHVIGLSNLSDGSSEPFLWRDGHLTGLGHLPSGGATRPSAVNDWDEVVGAGDTGGYIPVPGSEGGLPGEHAFLWRNGTVTDLNVGGGDYSQAFGINGLGQIVGESNTTPGGPIYPVVWTVR